MSYFNIDDSQYQYLVSNCRDERFLQSQPLYNNLIINYTSNTNVITVQKQDRSITIIGLCIDSYSKLAREEVPGYLCDIADTVESVKKHIGRLAGKYIIIYQTKENTYVFGDATSSLPVYYYEKDNAFSSSEHLLASKLNLSKNIISKEIQKKAIPNINLPYDLSHYNNIRFLLANHSLNLNTKKANRYFIPNDSSATDLLDIYKRSLWLIKNITTEYSKYYDLVCPLTAGSDSRVVLSFLKNEAATECYTLLIDNEDTSIPERICKDLNISHKNITVKKAPDEAIKEAYRIIGINNINNQRIDTSYTLRENYDGNNKALIYGDIIDQIGQSRVFSSQTPSICAAFDSFFVSKTNSFSKENSDYTKLYLQELRDNVSFDNLYDFFALEMRCGRWISQYSEVNNSLGNNLLNIFNNTELIMLWISIDRLQRTKAPLHKFFTESLLPELFDYPINPHYKSNRLKTYKYIYTPTVYTKFQLKRLKTQLSDVFSKYKNDK